MTCFIISLKWFGLFSLCLVSFGLVSFCWFRFDGLVWFGLVLLVSCCSWFRLVWFGFVGFVSFGFVSQTTVSL